MPFLGCLDGFHIIGESSQLKRLLLDTGGGRAPAKIGSGHQAAESFLVLSYCVMVVGPTSCITCVLMFREYYASIELEF